MDGRRNLFAVLSLLQVGFDTSVCIVRVYSKLVTVAAYGPAIHMFYQRGKTAKKIVLSGIFCLTNGHNCNKATLL